MDNASDSMTIVRAELTDEVSRALIGALNAELLATYPEPGATHFQLDPEQVAEGRGVFLVVYDGAKPVGCGALRQLDATTVELKRMYIAAGHRGTGLGKRLLAALEAEARGLIDPALPLPLQLSLPFLPMPPRPYPFVRPHLVQRIAVP